MYLDMTTPWHVKHVPFTGTVRRESNGNLGTLEIMTINILWTYYWTYSSIAGGWRRCDTHSGYYAGYTYYIEQPTKSKPFLISSLYIKTGLLASIYNFMKYIKSTG